MGSLRTRVRRMEVRTIPEAERITEVVYRIINSDGSLFQRIVRPVLDANQ